MLLGQSGRLEYQNHAVLTVVKDDGVPACEHGKSIVNPGDRGLRTSQNVTLK